MILLLHAEALKRISHSGRDIGTDQNPFWDALRELLSMHSLVCRTRVKFQSPCLSLEAPLTV